MRAAKKTKSICKTSKKTLKKHVIRKLSKAAKTIAKKSSKNMKKGKTFKIDDHKELQSGPLVSKIAFVTKDTSILYRPYGQCRRPGI